MSNLSPMGITRDHKALWIVLAASAVAYLATMPPPTEWTYAQWMQTIAAGLTALVAKLQTSPLAGKEEQ